MIFPKHRTIPQHLRQDVANLTNFPHYDIINMIIKEVVDGQVTDYIEKNKVETKTACKKKGFFSKLFN